MWTEISHKIMKSKKLPRSSAGTFGILNLQVSFTYTCCIVPWNSNDPFLWGFSQYLITAWHEKKIAKEIEGYQTIYQDNTVPCS